MNNKFTLLLLGLFLMCGMLSTQLCHASQTNDKMPRHMIIGAEFYDLTPKIRKILGNSKQKGVVAVNVFSGTPAEQAGIQTGDIILEVNGKKSKYYSDLLKTIATTPPETSLQFKVSHQDNTFLTSVTPVFADTIQNRDFQEYYVTNLQYSQMALTCENNMFNTKIIYWYLQSMEQLLTKLDSWQATILYAKKSTMA